MNPLPSPDVNAESRQRLVDATYGAPAAERQRIERFAFTQKTYLGSNVACCGMQKPGGSHQIQKQTLQPSFLRATPPVCRDGAILIRATPTEVSYLVMLAAALEALQKTRAYTIIQRAKSCMQGTQMPIFPKLHEC